MVIRPSGLRVLAALAMMALAGNAVPKHSPVELVEESDLVATVQMLADGVSARPVDDAFTEIDCIRAKILRVQKGTASGEIVICPAGVSECEPPAPTMGRTYQVYLSRYGDRGIFSPFSVQAFLRLSD